MPDNAANASNVFTTGIDLTRRNAITNDTIIVLTTAAIFYSHCTDNAANTMFRSVSRVICGKLDGDVCRTIRYACMITHVSHYAADRVVL